MPFSEAYLQALVAGHVTGDFAPFTLGNPAKTDHYVRKIVVRLQQNTHLLVEADFSSYGSGYASYVPVSISKKDRSDTVETSRKELTSHTTAGLLLYISRLVPYWFYGGATWSAHYEVGRYRGGSVELLDLEYQVAIHSPIWQADQQWLEAVLTEFCYGLLTATELEQPAPASITYLPTVLADPPYRVFDCFFYWLD